MEAPNRPNYVTHKRMEAKRTAEVQQKRITESRTLQAKVNAWWSAEVVPALVTEGAFLHEDDEWSAFVDWPDAVTDQFVHDALVTLIRMKVNAEGAPFEVTFDYFGSRVLRVEFTAM